MRVLLLAIGLCIALGNPPVQAASITVTNIADPITNSTVIVNHTGKLLENGFIAIGTFSISDDRITALWRSMDNMGILKGFTQVGNAIGMQSPGLFESLISGSVGADLAGKPIYSIIGNGSSLAGATSLLVWRYDGISFVADPFHTPDLIVAKGYGTLLAGYRAYA